MPTPYLPPPDGTPPNEGRGLLIATWLCAVFVSAALCAATIGDDIEDKIFGIVVASITASFVVYRIKGRLW